MVTDSSVLIDQTIEQLEILAAVFADEIDERIYRPGVSQEGALACKAAHARIGALLPALRAGRRCLSVRCGSGRSASTANDGSPLRDQLAGRRGQRAAGGTIVLPGRVLPEQRRRRADREGRRRQPCAHLRPVQRHGDRRAGAGAR